MSIIPPDPKDPATLTEQIARTPVPLPAPTRRIKLGAALALPSAHRLVSDAYQIVELTLAQMRESAAKPGGLCAAEVASFVALVKALGQLGEQEAALAARVGGRQLAQLSDAELRDLARDALGALGAPTALPPSPAELPAPTPTAHAPTALGAGPTPPPASGLGEGERLSVTPSLRPEEI